MRQDKTHHLDNLISYKIEMVSEFKSDSTQSWQQGDRSLSRGNQLVPTLVRWVLKETSGKCEVLWLNSKGGLLRKIALFRKIRKLLRTETGRYAYLHKKTGRVNDSLEDPAVILERGGFCQWLSSNWQFGFLAHVPNIVRKDYGIDIGFLTITI